MPEKPKGLFSFLFLCLLIKIQNLQKNYFVKPRFHFPDCTLQSWISPVTTINPVLKTLIWKRCVSKLGVLNRPISHVLNFTGWIKLIFCYS